MEKKYKLTEETLEIDGHVLNRIIALRDFGEVKKGDLGGFIEKESNLAHYWNCWIYNDAVVRGNAMVCDNAMVCGNAMVYGDATVYGAAKVCGNAKVCGEATVYGNADVGYRLYFKTSARAKQFGKQFEDLYNKVFL